MLRGDSMISKFHMPPLVSRDNVISIEISPQKKMKNWGILANREELYRNSVKLKTSNFLLYHIAPVC